MQKTNTIEKLLKGELSATESYQKILKELEFPGGKFLSDSLIPMFGEHKTTVAVLQEQIVKLGSVPPKNSGTWGSWPKLILENASLIGKRSAVKVLLEGEKTTEADYSAALKDSTISADLRKLIEKDLLPTQQSHVRSLDRVFETITD